MAPRSTVSTPAARAGTAASARPLSPAASVVGGEMVIGDEVAEPRGVAVEGELPRADRAVALLGDDHLGFAIGALAAFLPALQALVELVVVLAVALGRLGALNVILVAVDEHDDVGVLLDRAGLAQVGERSEEHTSELQSLMRISYAVFCLKKKKKTKQQN